MRSPRTPALLLGLGLGGFIDGIVLHQVLQAPHAHLDRRAPMTTLEGLEANTPVLERRQGLPGAD
jgi:uncharacterized membrane protein